MSVVRWVRIEANVNEILRIRKLVDEGTDLNERTAFNSNFGTAEKKIAKEKLDAFIKDFLARLIILDGENSSLRVFCRVDMSIYVDEGGRVSFFVNEVERGAITALWTCDGPSAVGHVGSDISWPLARWIFEEKVRLAR